MHTVRMEQSDRAGLRPFLAGFLGERHVGADGQPVEGTSQHTVFLEVER